MKKSLFLLLILLMPIGVSADCTGLSQTGSTSNVADWGHTDEEALAVPFTAACTGSVTTVTISARMAAGSGAASNLSVYTTTGSEPDTSLGTSDSFNVDDNVDDDYVVTFSTPVDVTMGEDYWIVFDNSGSVYSGANYYQNAGDTSGGAVLSRNGSSWTAAFGDNNPNVRFDISEGGSSSSGPLGGATSTVDQAQQNLGTGFFIFFFAFFGMVWLLARAR